MATPPTERQAEQQIRQVIEQASARSQSGEITVQWRDANPDDRPDGYEWNADTQTLTYDVWEAQRDALDLLDTPETDICGFLAGYGSGKTVFGTRWLLKQAIEHPNSRFLLMGIDFQKARDTTFRILFEQLPGERTGTVTSSYNGPEQSPLVTDYNRQSNRLTLSNDSVIKLGSADRWNRYAGDEYGAVHLDEPSHYGEDLHDLVEMIGSRLRGVDGPGTQLWTLTGEGRNAAFQILEREQDSTGEPLGLNIELYRASTLNNPFLSEAEKDRFKRQYAGTQREERALYGGWGSSGGTLLSRDQLQFINADELGDGRYKYHIGVDLAYLADKRKANETDSDHTAVDLVAYDQQDNLGYLLDVNTTRGATMREQIQWLGDLADDIPNPVVTVENTGAQRYFTQEARETIAGRVNGVSPTESKESRIQDMSILFEREDCVLVNQSIDEHLGYDSRFQPFVREWSQFESSDESPDVIDAVYYALHNLHLGDYGGTPVIEGADPFGT